MRPFSTASKAWVAWLTALAAGVSVLVGAPHDVSSEAWIALALLGACGAVAHLFPVRSARYDYLTSGRTLVHRRNCVGCHVIEGDGGDFVKLVSEPTLGPPTLTPEGARVQPDWLYAFLRYDTASGQRFLVVANLHRQAILRDVRVRHLLIPVLDTEIVGVMGNEGKTNSWCCGSHTLTVHLDNDCICHRVLVPMERGSFLDCALSGSDPNRQRQSGRGEYHCRFRRRVILAIRIE